MRHLRLSLDDSFWEVAESFLNDLPGEEDEGFSEPLCLQDLVELDLSHDQAVGYFFPETSVPDLPTDEAVEELLRCPEEMPVFTDDESDSEEVSPDTHFSALELDYPEIPGVNCSACNFHRIQVKSDEVNCALCYMRKTAYAVYGELRRW